MAGETRGARAASRRSADESARWPSRPISASATPVSSAELARMGGPGSGELCERSAQAAGRIRHLVRADRERRAEAHGAIAASEHEEAFRETPLHEVRPLL